MNTDQLTYGELKQIAALFSSQVPATASAHPMVGQFVIARCYSAGVHAGTVQAVDGENVILKDSVRLWTWTAADGVALSGVAQHGLTMPKSKLDSKNPTIYLTGVCELIPCSQKARESIDA